MSHWLKTWMKEMVVLPQDSFLRMRQNETAANICRHFAWMPLNFQFHHAFAVFAKSPSFGAMSIQLFLIHLILSKGGKGRHKQRLGFIMAMSKLAVSKGIHCCSNPPLSCLHNYIQCYENILISGHNLASEGPQENLLHVKIRELRAFHPRVALCSPVSLFASLNGRWEQKSISFPIGKTCSSH